MTDRRLASPEFVRGERTFLARHVEFVGVVAGHREIGRRPVGGMAREFGLLPGPDFQCVIRGFAGAVVARRARGREERHDVPGSQEFVETLALERGAVVGFEHEGRAEFVKQALQRTGGGILRFVGNREPGQLQTAGQIADREDRWMASVNRPGGAAVIHGPHATRLQPTERLLVHTVLAAELPPVIRFELAQLAAGHLGKQSPQRRQTEAGSGPVEQLQHGEPLAG